MKKEGFVNTSDKSRIYYTERGAGQPIVFIHGWSSTGEGSFRHLTERLEGTARCICFDLRGHGRSDTYHADAIHRLTEDLHDLIIALDLHDVILAGHSLGGLLIYDYFETYGGFRIAGAVILDMSPKVLCDTAWNYGLRVAEDLVTATFEREMQAMTAAFLSVGGRLLKSSVNMARILSPTPYGLVLYALWLDMLTADYRKGVAKIQVPLVYFYTDRGMYPASVSQWLAENVKGEYKGIDLRPHSHFTMLGEWEKIVWEMQGLLNV